MDYYLQNLIELFKNLSELLFKCSKATRALYEDETIDDEMLRNETTNKPAKTFSKQKQLAIIGQFKWNR